MMTRTTMHPFKMLAAVGAAFLLWGLVFAYASSPAQAATITVNSLTDDADPTDGECTLREAITSANNNTASGASTGECAAGSGDDIIDIGVTGTVDLTRALPDLSTNIDLQGPGADQFTVRRPDTEDEQYRIFTIPSTTDVDVSISGMTITGGNTRGDGGGILSGTDPFSETTTTTTITNSTISSNQGNRGGGVANKRGTMTITGSTISDNTAPDAGGGVYSSTGNLTSGQSTTITNSTISGNTATTFVGGGIYNFGGLTVVEHSTITDNTSRDNESDGSGVFSYGDSATSTEVLSTIISANSKTDVDSHTNSSFVSKGHNLIGDGNATGSFNQTADQIGVSDPGLDPLGSYGGPTRTHRLHSDSPAVDEGPPPSSCPPPATDQRGVDRPQDGDDDGTARCDIGSFELEEPPNAAPRVTVAAGGSCGTDHRSGTLRLRVSDADEPSSGLTLSATSSNRALVPEANVSFGGTGTDRTMRLRSAEGESGTANIRITVSDGDLKSTKVLTVKVGTNGVDAINGTTRADMLFGLDGVDAINGLGSNDLLCGGKGVDALNANSGDDTMGGGLGSDRFSGGTGTDTATDFSPSQGDTKDNTVETF